MKIVFKCTATSFIGVIVEEFHASASEIMFQIRISYSTMVVTTALENPEYTWDQFLNALGGSLRQVSVIFENKLNDFQNMRFATAGTCAYEK